MKKRSQIERGREMRKVKSERRKWRVGDKLKCLKDTRVPTGAS